MHARRKMTAKGLTLSLSIFVNMFTKLTKGLECVREYSYLNCF